LEEFPELFMEYNVAKEIYKENRKYKLFETTHSSDFDTKNKLFYPDKFILVSRFNTFKLYDLGVPMEVIEYPIDKKKRTLPEKVHAMEILNLDSEYKHVLNVGLFTPRKNQAYAFEIARKLENEKILFHFVGNQADNFKHYWEPLLKNKPKNCIIWGERSDVYNFYTACDAFLFTSRGFKTDKELNPLVIKEAIQEDIHLFLFPLDVYCGKYDYDSDVSYLTGDIEKDSKLLLDYLNNTKDITSIYNDIKNDVKIINIIKDDNSTLPNKFGNYEIENVKLIKHDGEIPLDTCLRPDDIGTLGYYGINDTDYDLFLTYKHIINNIIDNNYYQYIIVNNINNKVTFDDKLLEKLNNIVSKNDKYNIDTNIITINPTINNML
jgi:glycosyltransferase involved in cell wall biosynthesis